MGKPRESTIAARSAGAKSLLIDEAVELMIDPNVERLGGESCA